LPIYEQAVVNPIYEQAVVNPISRIISTPAASAAAYRGRGRRQQASGVWGREGGLEGTLGASWVPSKALLSGVASSLLISARHRSPAGCFVA